jgi:hypothetical protein
VGAQRWSIGGGAARRILALVTRVGITGHIALTPLSGDAESAWKWVDAAMARELHELAAPFTGLSSLAGGADQHFARLVLEHGGRLEAFLPFAGYRRLLRDEVLAEFDELLAKASKQEVLHPEIDLPVGDQARNGFYLEAGRRIVDEADSMFAVWERGRGGSPAATYQMVQYARQQRRPLVILDPRTRLVSREP